MLSSTHSSPFASDLHVMITSFHSYWPDLDRAVSAANALITLWLTSSRDSAPDELAAAYDTCFRIMVLRQLALSCRERVARRASRDDVPPDLPLQGVAGWNGCVDEELRRELLARRDEDQRIRNLVSPPQGQYMARLPDEVAAEWQRIDEENTRWLGELLNARGWPGRTLVSEEGTDAAWLLAQHADRDPVRQRAFLHALRGAVDQGEAGPCPIEDRQRLDKRRAEAGLVPFADYEARMRAQ